MFHGILSIQTYLPSTSVNVKLPFGSAAIHEVMKVEVNLYAFLLSASDGNEW
jgi:hypothetical protein